MTIFRQKNYQFWRNHRIVFVAADAVKKKLKIMAFVASSWFQPVKLLAPTQYCSGARRASYHRTQRLCLFQSSQLSWRNEVPRLRNSGRFSHSTIVSANVTGPAYDSFESESDKFKVEDSTESSTATVQPSDLISWGLLWNLVSRHKLRLFLSILALVGCSTSTLTMPIYSGEQKFALFS